SVRCSPQREQMSEIPTTTDHLPVERSGRHRPASVSVKGVQARSWKFSQDSADHRNVRSVK
ncbi:MAG: hypothetical protein V3V65_03700, partial [Hyphomicrobium sp.]